jgi:hypothetical protein
MDNSVIITANYWLDDRGTTVVSGRDFSLHRQDQKSSAAHTVSYPMAAADKEAGPSN